MHTSPSRNRKNAGSLDAGTPGRPDDPLFASIRGGKLSRDAVERLVEKYISIAAEKCQSLKRKNVSPHALRHSAAMDLLQMGSIAP